MTAAPARALPALHPATYAPHSLHDAQRAWPESNCYIDLWIEILHSLGLDPHACLPFAVGSDFEGDQWTFLKPAPSELWELYGIDVQELSIWRSLLHEAGEQVAQGRLVLPEVDAYFLPDTSATDYKTRHNKTTIAIKELDVAAGRLGYFHNGGYFHLQEADFAGVFRLTSATDALPTYVEFVKLDRLRHRRERELTGMAVDLLRSYLRKLAPTNPLPRFGEKISEHLEWLFAGSANFHSYAFVNLRQLGAGCELAATLVRWLLERGETGIEPAAVHYESLAAAAKTLQLKMARAANGKKTFDAAPLILHMATAWTAAIDCLLTRYGSP